MEFNRPATRLAEASFFLEIFGLLDLSIDPTTKPTTIRGTMIGICVMESPLLDQHLGPFNKAVYHNCTQFFTKSICSKFPPETAYMATTGAGALVQLAFCRCRSSRTLPFLKSFWTNSGKEQNVASVHLGMLLDLLASATLCVLACLTVKVGMKTR